MISEDTLEKIEENRKRMTPIQKLVDDLYWEYDRMSSSGQKTLNKLFAKVFKEVEKKNEK
jgi:predicted SnoaL-like aldol condensation-catalyzing enzyme